MSFKRRFKPRRRNVSGGSKKHCLRCLEPSPCLWKLEARIDSIAQHSIAALKLIRKLTAENQKKLLEVSGTAAKEKQ